MPSQKEQKIRCPSSSSSSTKERSEKCKPICSLPKERSEKCAKEESKRKEKCRPICPPTLPINFSVGNTADQEGVVRVINGTEPERLFRNGITSTCDSIKICPGPFPATVPYTALEFHNPGRRRTCVTITVTNLAPGTSVFSHAHLKRYNPRKICKNYLGDEGLSRPVGTPSSYQVILPEGTKKFVVVLEGVVENQLPASGLLTISGLACQAPTSQNPAQALKASPVVASPSNPVAGPGNDLKAPAS